MWIAADGVRPEWDPACRPDEFFAAQNRTGPGLDEFCCHGN